MTRDYALTLVWLIVSLAVLVFCEGHRWLRLLGRDVARAWLESEYEVNGID